MWRFNACVGHNGWNGDFSYVDGYDESVRAMGEHIFKSGQATIDTIVYPYMFLVRHCVEIFLKRYLKSFGRIKGNITIDDKFLKSSHDISNLWIRFERAFTRFDERTIEDVHKLKAFVNFIADIDPNGQTFRYAYNIENKLHLTDRNIINLKEVHEEYLKFSDSIKIFEMMYCYLEEEYSCNTFTENLSRVKIEEISQQLPNRQEWSKKGNIKETIANIRSDYNISANEMNKCIKIIESNYKFSNNIGLEKKISLSISVLKIYINKFLKIYKSCILRAKGFHKTSEEEYNYTIQCIEELKLIFKYELTKEDALELYCLYKFNYAEYPEKYDEVRPSIALNPNEDENYIRKEISQSHAFLRIWRSLESLGQTSLLTAVHDTILAGEWE